MKKNFSKKRKGLTLIEAIIVIVIMAIFALIAFQGGKPVINSANRSAAQNDMHTFELAAKQLLLEHPEYVGLVSTAPNFATETVNTFNRYLPDEMLVTGSTSQKLDPWSKNYTVIFHPDDTTKSYFRIYVVTNGPNGKTGSGGKLGSDDLVMCVELRAGNVKSAYFGIDNDIAADTVVTSLVP